MTSDRNGGSEGPASDEGPMGYSETARRVAQLLEWAARRGKGPMLVEEIVEATPAELGPTDVRKAIEELKARDLVSLGPEGVVWSGWQGPGPWIRRRKLGI